MLISDIYVVAQLIPAGVVLLNQHEIGGAEGGHEIADELRRIGPH